MTAKTRQTANEQPTSSEQPANLRPNKIPTEGYAVAVDAKIKSHYPTSDEAFKAGSEIKRKFPVVHVAVFDIKQGTRTAVEVPQEPEQRDQPV